MGIYRFDDMDGARWWLRPMCFVFGHRWVVLRVNYQKAFCFTSQRLEDVSKGMDLVCSRCGKEKFDA